MTHTIHIHHTCRHYAMSVCLCVRLWTVITVNKMRKWTHNMIDWCLGYLHAKADPDWRNRNIVYNPPTFTEEYQWSMKNVGVCTSALADNMSRYPSICRGSCSTTARYLVAGLWLGARSCRIFSLLHRTHGTSWLSVLNTRLMSTSFATKRLLFTHSHWNNINGL